MRIASRSFCLLLTAFCLLPTAFCLLPSSFCLLLTAYCLLPTAYCLLLFAVPIASELLLSLFRSACRSAGHAHRQVRSLTRRSTDRAPCEFPTKDLWGPERCS